MVPDRQNMRTDGRTDGRKDGRNGQTDGRTDDAKTISLRLRRGIINLVEVHKMMLHTKYQDSRPCGFRQGDFFHVFYKPI